MEVPPSFFEPLPDDLLDAFEGGGRRRVNLLLDTCTFLWLAADDPRLTPGGAGRLSQSGQRGIPELALGVGDRDQTSTGDACGCRSRPARYVVSRRTWLELEPLPFDEACAAHDALLPCHHRDPFDRGLVSQAILNGMTIVTPDPRDRRLSRADPLVSASPAAGR